MFYFSFIKNLRLNFIFGKKKRVETTQGGDGGRVFIAARTIRGTGQITADGGDGDIGGAGGKVVLITENNEFAGNISAKGGKSGKSIK